MNVIDFRDNRALPTLVNRMGMLITREIRRISGIQGLLTTGERRGK
jgi:hypothetical protein